MGDCIFVACDVHESNIVVLMAEDANEPARRRYASTVLGQRAIIKDAQQVAQRTGASQIVFTYEAGLHGFGSYDEMAEAGHRCFVLAPTRIERSPKHEKNRDAYKDALKFLGIVRSGILAGAAIPGVWIPDPDTRADRVLVRRRIGARRKPAGVRAQVRCLLKQFNMGPPPWNT